MKESFVGDVAISWYNEDILIIRHLEKWKGEDNLSTARDVMRAVYSYTGRGSRKGLLIILPSVYKKKEILDYYRRVDINEAARALVIPSFAAKIIGNMYLKLASGNTNEKGRHVPSKLFTHKEDAVEWLIKEVETHQKNNGTPQ